MNSGALSSDFAKAAVPLVVQIQKLARELDALHSDAPDFVRLEPVMVHSAKIRKNAALLLDFLEGLAER